MEETPLQNFMMTLIKKYKVLSLDDIPINLLLLERPFDCKQLSFLDDLEPNIDIENVLYLPDKPCDNLPKGYCWYGLRLSYLGVKRKNFNKAIKQAQNIFEYVFVPYCYDKTGKDDILIPFMDDILFVAFNRDKDDVNKKLRYNKLLLHILTDVEGNLSVFTIDFLKDLYSKIEKEVCKQISLGTKVRVLSGVYKNLVGKVIGCCNNNMYYIELTFLSTTSVITISPVFLELVEPEYENPFEMLNLAYISYDTILNDLKGLRK